MPSPLTKAQISAGGVVYRKQDGAIEVVLIAVGSPLRWQLPKGLVKSHEAPEEAALREVREETGIACRLRAPLEKIEYWYYEQSRGQRVRFHKVVHFFLLEFESGNTADHDHEVEEARWVEIEQAQTLLAFKNEQKVVKQAQAILQVELV
jgi:8-oxo-dGTP diphosphatase